MQKREVFKERFEKLFPKNVRLLAIQLDGFTHCVVYDTGSGTQIRKELYSSNVGEEEAKMYKMNSERVKELFKGFSNYMFQNQAEEIVYVYPNER